MTQLNNEIYAVKVPEGLLSPQYSFEISIGRMLDLETDDDEFVISHRERACGSPIGKIVIPIPPGSYTFLFCTKDVTEEQARKVVLKDGIFCRNYSVKSDDHPFGWTDDPLESLETLLKSKGCEGEFAVVRKK